MKDVDLRTRHTIERQQVPHRPIGFACCMLASAITLQMKNGSATQVSFTRMLRMHWSCREDGDQTGNQQPKQATSNAGDDRPNLELLLVDNNPASTSTGTGRTSTGGS